MKTEWRVFAVVAVFLLGVGIVYGWWTGSSQHGVDWAGATALLLSFGLCAMLAGFFWFVSRRIEPRPEDRADGEIAEGAGEIGFFSPGSYWPFGVALSATVTALGVTLWQYWLMALGFAMVIGSTAGLLFEYYTDRKSVV